MHVVDEQRAQHQERVAVGGLDHAALGQPDHRVVGDGAAVGVELAARRQHHRVVPALGVGELHAVADDERTGCAWSQPFSLPADAPHGVPGVAGCRCHRPRLGGMPEHGPARAAGGRRCRRRGPPTSSSARCCTASARSTGCRSRRPPRRCADRSCTPRSSSSTRCPPPTGSRRPRCRWSTRRGSGCWPPSPDLADGLGADDADRAARRGPCAAVRVLPAGGSDPVRPGELRAARRGRTRRRHPAARLRRPHRRRRHRRGAGGGLQDRQGAAGGAGARRVQGAVPDEVLRGGAAALARTCCPPGCG